jgi:exo-1,4-beta-D-glucosaminidase
VNVTVRFYNLDGTQKHMAEARNLSVPSNSSIEALKVERFADLSPVYFVRCQMTDATGRVLADNTFWQSTDPDDVGPASNDRGFEVKWSHLGEMTALNSMPGAHVAVSGDYAGVDGETRAQIRLINNSDHVAFFVRAEVTADADGPEVLPIRYDDNYITVFPHETRTIDAVFDTSLLNGHKPALRVEGYDVPKQVVPLAQRKAR